MFQRKSKSVYASRSAVCTLLAALACRVSVISASAQSTARSVTVQYHYFPGMARMDGNWAALKAASDGRVYVGLACHGCDGHLVYFDSHTGRMVDAGNLTAMSGESGLGLGPQSKIHAKIGEGKDGRIYFATHGGWWFEYSRYAAAEGYPGSHYMAFDPKTGTTQDFGIGPRFEGMNTGAYDPRYNRIYGLTHPRGHFVYYDVASGAKLDKGRINNWDSICRTLGIDDDGNVYGSFADGRIFKYDPRTDDITEFSARLPVRAKGVSIGRDYNKSETAWRVVVWDRETRKFYGVEESASTLFSFDPAAPLDRQVEILGSMCVPGFENRRDVAYATLSLTIGADRKLYYGAAGAEFDYQGTANIAASHLIAYDLHSHTTTDLGEMRLPDGRPVLGTNAADTAADGTIYLVGAVGMKEEDPKDPGRGGTIGGKPFRLALFSFHPGDVQK